MKLFGMPAIVVYLKEMHQSVRDRRVLLNALLVVPLMGRRDISDCVASCSGA